MNKTISHFEQGVWLIKTSTQSYIADLDEYTIAVAGENNYPYALEDAFKLVELYATVGGNINIAVRRKDSLPVESGTLGIVTEIVHI
jgi:hypothetical protein